MVITEGKVLNHAEVLDGTADYNILHQQIPLLLADVEHGQRVRMARTVGSQALGHEGINLRILQHRNR